eukprot:362519-Chlamydomonas_euryale.AAC.3
MQGAVGSKNRRSKCDDKCPASRTSTRIQGATEEHQPALRALRKVRLGVAGAHTSKMTTTTTAVQ